MDRGSALVEVEIADADVGDVGCAFAAAIGCLQLDDDVALVARLQLRCKVLGYSNRSATIGSSREAR